MKKLRLCLPYIFTLLGIVLIYLIVPNSLNQNIKMITQQDLLRPTVNQLLYVPYLIILSMVTVLTIIFSSKQFKTKKGMLVYNIITLLFCFALAYVSKILLFA